MFNIFSRALRVTLLVIEICTCPEVVLKAVIKSVVTSSLLFGRNKTMSWSEDLSVFVNRHIWGNLLWMTAGEAQTGHTWCSTHPQNGCTWVWAQIRWHFVQTFIVPNEWRVHIADFEDPLTFPPSTRAGQMFTRHVNEEWNVWTWYHLASLTEVKYI